MKSVRPRIYLAGPDVFRLDAVARGDRLKSLCLAHGLDGVYPLDGPELSDGRAVRAQCIEMIRSADAVVANISPFRGYHMDPGTAYEIGYAEAIGMPVFLWSHDTRPLVMRVPGGKLHQRDTDDNLIGEFGEMENLMIVGGQSLVHQSEDAAIRQAASHLRAHQLHDC